jgi:hypothetical protein
MEIAPENNYYPRCAGAGHDLPDDFGARAKTLLKLHPDPG